jgi:hypothetical protein
MLDFKMTVDLDGHLQSRRRDGRLFPADRGKVRSIYRSGAWVAFVLSVLFTSVTLAQSVGGGNFWECQTNGVDGGRAATQAQAAANWLAHFGGQFVQSDSCGALGTPSYNFCPISDGAGFSEGNMDVHLVCMPGGFVSSDGVNCPGQYYVSSDVMPLSGYGCETGDGREVGARAGPDNGNELSEWWHDCNLKFVPDVPYSVWYTKDSSLYATASAACIQGWTQVAAIRARWANAVASYADGACSLRQNGSVVGTVVVRNAASRPPSVSGAPR